ncbi:MAG: glycine--tRNA ligase subunit beta [Acidisphaera sp.]|nr:glycine--tRNA ligase subunit beta [Acidisphaera sp.]
MPEFLLELFSEEIPARMQVRAAEDLSRLAAEALAALSPENIRSFSGPRRIAVTAELHPAVPASEHRERGPRLSAPEQAIAGFLRKHQAARADLHEQGEYWVLRQKTPARPAQEIIAAAVPPMLRRFPWPKSMRWGENSTFVWVRPLRRILCLLDGAVVPFDLRDGADDGHDLAAGDLTEGHRFMAPSAFAVRGAEQWRNELRARRVLVDTAERRQLIADGIAARAAERQLHVVSDDTLLDELAGLAEWPVPMIGKIDAAYMDLPPEVMQVSMRVNQRYFALRHADASPAPFFAFIAGIEAADGGAAIIAGNERVLRARFADARHFWDSDRRTRLEDRVPALDGIVFHAKLGSQGDRVRRLENLAEKIAPLVSADPALARRAAHLAKADLTTGMVGEFPELQGVMGRYYALHDGEDARVADTLRDHYLPKSARDAVPEEPVAIAVALADKIDQLGQFFAADERPTGSGDPYALRRSGLGIVHIVRENGLQLSLLPLLEAAGGTAASGILAFLAERLRVQMRQEGARHDVLDAVFAIHADDNFTRLLVLTYAVGALLGTPDGADLLTAYRRAANILRIEDRKDGPHTGVIDRDALVQREEIALSHELANAEMKIDAALANEDFHGAMIPLSLLRPAVDAFFDRVTVNAPEPELRRNRLRLLARLRDTMNCVADFSRIEG